MAILRLPRLLRGRIAAPYVGRGKFVGRARTTDVAFPYRMGAGFAGDVNRSHPVTIEPAKADATNVPPGYGFGVLANTAANSVRAVLTTDTTITTLYGVTVRPYPIQAASAPQSYGGQGFGAVTGAIAANEIIDVLRAGYIMVPVVGAVAKGGPVFVWVAAASGAHIVGGFEAAAAGANTAALDPLRYQWNGPADASGIAELAFNV